MTKPPTFTASFQTKATSQPDVSSDPWHSMSFQIALPTTTQTLPTHVPASAKPTRNSVWLILCCRRKGPPQRPPCPSSSSIHSSQRRGATCNSCSLVNSAGRGRGIGTAGDARCIAKKNGGNRCETVPRFAKDQANAMVMWNMYENDPSSLMRGSVWGRPYDSNDSMVRMNAFNWHILYTGPLASQNYSTVPHLEDDHSSSLYSTSAMKNKLLNFL